MKEAIGAVIVLFLILILIGGRVPKDTIARWRSS